MSYFLSEIKYIIQQHPINILQKENCKNSRTRQHFAKNITKYYLSSYILCKKCYQSIYITSIMIYVSMVMIARGVEERVFNPKMTNEEYNKGTCFELFVFLLPQR